MTITMTISLPDSLMEFVQIQVQTGGYRSASDYICELIRADQKRKLEQRLSQLLLEGIKSGPPVVADAAYWDKMRQEILLTGDDVS